MSEQSNIFVALITGGLGAALGTVGTAIVQSFSKKRESRATAADLVTNAAGNLADRLDKFNTKLELENMQMRKALILLTEAVEDMMSEVADVEKREKIQNAINAARLAFR